MKNFMLSLAAVLGLAVSAPAAHGQVVYHQAYPSRPYYYFYWYQAPSYSYWYQPSPYLFTPYTASYYYRAPVYTHRYVASYSGYPAHYRYPAYGAGAGGPRVGIGRR